VRWNTTERQKKKVKIKELVQKGYNKFWIATKKHYLKLHQITDYKT
jgi:hypothetical protein